MNKRTVADWYRKKTTKMTWTCKKKLSVLTPRTSRSRSIPSWRRPATGTCWRPRRFAAGTARSTGSSCRWTRSASATFWPAASRPSLTSSARRPATPTSATARAIPSRGNRPALRCSLRNPNTKSAAIWFFCNSLSSLSSPRYSFSSHSIPCSRSSKDRRNQNECLNIVRNEIQLSLMSCFHSCTRSDAETAAFLIGPKKCSVFIHTTVPLLYFLLNIATMATLSMNG